MKYQIVGKNITVTEAISNALTKKLSKMDKYFKNDDEVVCRAVVRTYKKNEAKVEITIFSTDTTFRAEVKSDDLYKAFDLAIDKLLGQMRKLKSQLKKRYDRAGVGNDVHVDFRAVFVVGKFAEFDFYVNGRAAEYIVYVHVDVDNDADLSQK